jgi:acyl-homoserine lactone synthase
MQMVLLVTQKNRAEHAAILENMHRERKCVFVDQLKWDVPCEGDIERDQFDDAAAEYLIIADASTGAHLGSMRLLRTDKPHILGSLYPHLCERIVPASPDIREITRLCLSRKLKSADRRMVFHRLVTALVEYGMLSGISAYTAVTSMHWLTQTLSLGWRCVPLGLPQTVGGEMVAAMMIHIEPNTIQLLRDAGSYQTTGMRLEEISWAHAA